MEGGAGQGEGARRGRLGGPRKIGDPVRDVGHGDPHPQGPQEAFPFRVEGDEGLGPLGHGPEKALHVAEVRLAEPGRRGLEEGVEDHQLGALGLEEVQDVVAPLPAVKPVLVLEDHRPPEEARQGPVPLPVLPGHHPDHLLGEGQGHLLGVGHHRHLGRHPFPQEGLPQVAVEGGDAATDGRIGAHQGQHARPPVRSRGYAPYLK